MGRAGKLNFTVDHVKAPDGSNLKLRASSTRKGEDKTGTVIVGTVLLSPLFLIMRGKDVEIAKGTEITAYIDGDREIATAGQAQPEAIGLASMAAVSFASTPDGADITVDGKFMGNTPATLQLKPGDHTLLIEKATFHPWTRTMSVSGTSNVNATLEK